MADDMQNIRWIYAGNSSGCINETLAPTRKKCLEKLSALDLRWKDSPELKVEPEAIKLVGKPIRVRLVPVH